MNVKLFGNLRQYGGGSHVAVDLGEGRTVADLLERLFALCPALRPHVVTPEGDALLPHVNIMLNGRLIRDLQGLQTPVSEEDSVAIFPPSAGG